MRRNFLVCAAALTILLLAGCSQAESRMGYIGAEAAKQTALEAASVSAGEAHFTSTDMGTRNGLDYYHLCFEAGGQQYEYDVDALTGVVISAQTPAQGTEQPAPSEPQTGENPSDPPQETEGAPVETQAPPSADPAGQGTTAATPAPRPSENVPTAPPAISQPPATAAPVVTTPAPSAYIGESEAKRIALQHAGLTAGQVTFVHVKLDREDGRWVYDVEFYTPNYEEYDYEIDAYTGAVLSYDYDAEHGPQRPSVSTSITAEQAKQLVLARVPGATAANFHEFETDYDDGRLRYEGELIYNGMEYEFEIDGYSGSFLEWSSEPHHH